MRFLSYSNALRAFYALASTTSRVSAVQTSVHPFTRSIVLRSMPIIPFLGSFFSTASSPKMSFPVQKGDSEWQAVLSPEQFRVLRQKGTEAPYTGKYDKAMPSSGVFTCAGCNAPLYKANHKFKSGCGWPAFYDAVPGAVTRHTDSSFGMERTEIVCSNCGGHLGHVFKGEGYPTPTDERHCVNSISLNFSADDPVTEVNANGAPKV